MKIYLSPSSQTENVWGETGQQGSTEAEQMQAFSLLLKEYLEDAGYEVYGCDNTKILSERIKESNDLGVDLHIPLHSNGIDMHGTASGPLVLYSAGKSPEESQLLSKLIFDELYEEYVADGGTSARNTFRTDTHLGELKQTKATVAFIEVAFHDNDNDVDWMLNNWDEIAEAITKGVDYYAHGLRDKNGDFVLGGNGKPALLIDEINGYIIYQTEDKNGKTSYSYLSNGQLKDISKRISEIEKMLKGGSNFTEHRKQLEDDLANLKAVQNKLNGEPATTVTQTSNYKSALTTPNLSPSNASNNDPQIIELMVLSNIRPDVKKRGGDFYIWRSDNVNTCKDCSSRNGEVREKPSDWKIQPPLHPNCKCRIEKIDGIAANTATLNGVNKHSLLQNPSGTIYDNATQKLPSRNGRLWAETPVKTPSEFDYEHRIFYSNDGLVFISYDGGQTFYEIL